MGKEALSERRFGLLSCDHPFCLACVRGWRSHVDGGADVDSVSLVAPFIGEFNCRTGIVVRLFWHGQCMDEEHV